MGEPVLTTMRLRPETDGEVALRAARWQPGTAPADGKAVPDIIMLHDGLGSISQWRSVPQAVAEATGRTVLAYERPGHGASTPVPTGPWPADWLHQQADLLGDLIDATGAQNPILVGHSDGGSIALLYAAQTDSRTRAVLALAAHSWVEQICFDSIVGMRRDRARIEAGLARHHEHPAALFEAWSGVWVSPEFRSWDVRPDLSTIEVPTLIAQGAQDAYASQAHAHLTAAAIGDNARSQIVPDVGHIMHHDDAGVVSSLITQFCQ